MSAVLFRYPEKAAFGRVVPKTKIYEHAKPGSALRELFVKQIDKIVWQYKLAPETINLPAKDGVKEIQIFGIELKTEDFNEDLLRAIDKAVPHPIFFELAYKDKLKAMAAFKRQSDTTRSKPGVEGYFGTGWISVNTIRRELPVALNMAALYEEMLQSYLPLAPRKHEALKDQVDRWFMTQRKQAEAKKIEVSMRKEKQFNRKVELNSQLRTLLVDIEKLSR